MWHVNDQFSLKSRVYAISLPSDPSIYIAKFKPLCLNGFMNYYAGFPSWLGDEYYQFLMNIDDKPQWYIYHAPTHTLTDVMPSELLQEFREANTRLTVAGWGQFPVK